MLSGSYEEVGMETVGDLIQMCIGSTMLAFLVMVVAGNMSRGIRDAVDE